MEYPLKYWTDADGLQEAKYAGMVAQNPTMRYELGTFNILTQAINIMSETPQAVNKKKKYSDSYPHSTAEVWQ